MKCRILRWSLAAIPAIVLAGCGTQRPATPIASTPPQTKPHPPVVKASAPAIAAPVFEVRPVSSTLQPGDPGLQFLVEGTGKGGGRVYRASEASWTAEPSGIVEVGRDGYVRPVKPGKAKVSATIGGKSVAAEIEVAAGEGADRPWSFAADVVPILTRQGCNTGGCHGKADGQNGFHLSLFGYDPAEDYRSITRGEQGRRLSPFDPEQSLLIRKATGRTPHAGGQRLVPGSDPYRVMLAWIAAGAPETKGKLHGAVAKIVVEPTDAPSMSRGRARSASSQNTRTAIVAT